MQPLRSKGNKAQVARTKSIPAPTNGWYVGDNQAAPPPKTAIVLNNAFPQLDYVRARGGSSAWATGIGASAVVASLLPWTTGITSKMFAVANNSIYDVTNSGAVGAAQVTGLGSNYLEYCQFEGYGATYLIAVDGVDPVQIFDGTGWNRTFVLNGTLNSTINVTGLSSTANLQPGMALSGTGIPTGTTIATVASSTAITLSTAATVSGVQSLTFYQNAPITGYPGTGFSHVWSYKGRLYFADAQTQNAWYLGLASIGGPAYLLPLGAFFSFGGYLLCGSTWAVNSTAGSFQGIVFISSEGEILMYDGDYPGATNWELLGTYKISRPVGRRCLMRAGGDLLIMTEDGIVAMSQVVTLDQVALENVAVSKPIAPAWRDAVIARAGIAGWQIVPWPLQTMVVINLPKQNAGDYTQYVVNSRTGAWAQYLGWDANCFAVFNNNLFYGSSVGTVVQAETGAADNSVNGYTTTIMMAFDSLNAPAAAKQVRLVKPYVLAAASINQQVNINVDFNTTLPAAPAPSVALTGALWDTAVWDGAVWGGGLTNQTQWLDAQGEGVAISVVWQMTTNQGAVTPDVRVAAFDVLYETGSVAGG